MIVLLGTVIALSLMVLQNPKVQTRLAKELLQKIEESIDGEVSFGSLCVYPWRTVVLRDLLITDRHPYIDSRGCSQDTLAWAGYVSANLFNIKSILGGEGLHFSSICVRDGGMYLIVEPWEGGPKDKRDNLSRIFGFQKDKYELVDGEWRIRDKEQAEQGNVFDAAKVEVDGFHFMLRSYVKEKHYPEGCINFSDMDVTDIHVKGHKMAFKGGIMSAVADAVSFREKSGYVCDNVSGSVRVGEGRTVIEDIRINDQWSDIKLESLIFSYETARAWKYFPQQVRIDGTIQPTRLSLRSLGFFTRAVNGMTLMTEVEGKVGGCIDDFGATSLSITFPEVGVSALLSGTISGLPKSPVLSCDLTPTLCFSTAGLEEIVRDKNPSSKLSISQYAPGTEFRFQGSICGPLDSLDISGDFTSQVGSLSAKVTVKELTGKGAPLQLNGKIGTQNLDVGHIANVGALHELSMRSDLSAVLGEQPSFDIDSIFVSRLNLLGYDYTGIGAAGEYSQGSFNGRLICNDPNLNFLFQGIFTPSARSDNAAYKFYANLGYADLHALHLDGRDVSKLSFLMNANFNRMNGGEVLGEVNVKKLVLQDGRGIHNVGDIEINSHVNDNVNRVRLDSKFMEASFVGSAPLMSFIKDLSSRTMGDNLPALSGAETKAQWSGNYYHLDLDMHDSQDVLSFFKSGLYVADSTSLRLQISRDGNLQGRLRSQRIASGRKYFRNMTLEAETKDSVLLGRLRADEFNWPPFHTLSNSVDLVACDNQLGARLAFDNSREGLDKGQLYFTADISRSKGDTLGVQATILPSSFSFNGAPWQISEAGIALGGGDGSISGLSISSEDQSITLDGGWSKTRADTLGVHLDGADMALIGLFLGDEFGLSGRLSGHGELISTLSGRKTMTLAMQADSTVVAGKDAGELSVNGKWDLEADGFRFSLVNSVSGKSSITAGGLYIPASRNLNLRMRLDSLDIGYAQPLLSSVFSEMGGGISGEISIKGPLDELEVSSTDATIDNAMLRIDFTGVPYWADGAFSLNSTGLRFTDPSLVLHDRYGSGGSLKGSIEWNRFKNMRLDLHASLGGMEALCTTRESGAGFYGEAFATGDVNISGPLEAIRIEVDAATTKSGSITIPLGGAAATRSNLLTFTQKESTAWMDPYELMMLQEENEEKTSGDLSAKLRLQVNQGTQAFIDMGSSGGNSLSGRGNGQLEIEVQPSKDLFNLSGSYSMSSGAFHFSVLDIVSRDFEIEEGSTVNFAGELMDSELDIHAVYKTRASVATLISDTTSTATRRQVECGIGLSGRLSNPQLEFSIEIPDLDPTTQARVQSALNTEDKVQKQFLALLVSNGFLPDESSGIVNNSSLLVSNVTEVMASQLNNILQKLDIPLDFGLDYGQDSSGGNVFDVAVSTELFNNRVVVNGSIGNRDYSSTSSGSDVAGDIDIEIKLDRAGALRLVLFSHSADQYTNYLDNSQRNGGGFSYQREFDTFPEFIRTMFRGRQKREKADILRQETLREAQKNRLIIGGDDSSTDKKNRKKE